MSPTSDDDVKLEQPRSHSALPWLLLLAVLVAAGVGGWLAYAGMEADQKALAAARTAAGEAEARARALETDRASLLAAKKTLEEQNGQLEGAVKDKDAELAKLKVTYDTLEEKMKDEIKSGDIKLSQAGGKIQVDLVDKILFDSGKAELSSRGAEVLARVGAVLARVEDKSIQVSGHTDDSPPSERLTGTFPTNWELSTARAVNVVRFLSEKASVPAKRLVAAGYGQFHPLATNANPAGRARNRRIEILLTPTLDAKPSTLVAESAPAAPHAAPAAKAKVVSAKAAAAPKKTAVLASGHARPKHR